MKCAKFLIFIASEISTVIKIKKTQNNQTKNTLRKKKKAKTTKNLCNSEAQTSEAPLLRPLQHTYMF